MHFLRYIHARGYDPSQAIILSTVKYDEPFPDSTDVVLKASLLIGSNIMGRVMFYWILGKESNCDHRRLKPNLVVDGERKYCRTTAHVLLELATYFAAPTFFV